MGETGKIEKRIVVVGATGASGMPILKMCLENLRKAEDVETHLILSDSAKLTYYQETNHAVDEITKMADVVYDITAVGAAVASGSFKTSGMLIVPCSMKTVAGIASGYADNLILRAADVTIKEKRPLVLAARETPLSRIHLKNLYELSQISEVRIIPPMMTFYHNPGDMNDMIQHIVAKLLEPFQIDVKGYWRWKGLNSGS